MNSAERYQADVLRSFHQGIALAKMDEKIEPFEVYDAAIGYAVNDWGVKRSYVDSLVWVHYTNRGGFPDAW